MEHPYRPTDGGPTTHARVLAGANRLRTLWHLTLILGLLAVGAWALSVTFGHPMAWLVVVAVVCVAADFARTLHEGTMPHRITADSRGIELVWAEKAPWRPWMRRRSEAIAWDELVGVRTSTVSINGVETTELLIDRARGLTLTIPHGTFAPGADAVQQAILDERDDRIEAPRREAADVAGFCRDRFAKPCTFHLRPNPLQRVAGTLIALVLIGGCGFVGYAIGGVALLVMAPGLLAGGIILYATWTSPIARVLRLQADGLAHGATEAQLELAPWSDIRFARPRVVNGDVVSVRVETKQGREVHLAGSYGVALAELAVMIAPPVEMVSSARERGR